MWKLLLNPPSRSPQSVRQNLDLARPAGACDDWFLNVGPTYVVIICLQQCFWLLSAHFVFIFHCSFSCRVALCTTPGCFLQSLSNPGSTYGRNFKQNKEDLTCRLYQLYNTSVFDSKVISNSCLPSRFIFNRCHWIWIYFYMFFLGLSWIF